MVRKKGQERKKYLHLLRVITSKADRKLTLLPKRQQGTFLLENYFIFKKWRERKKGKKMLVFFSEKNSPRKSIILHMKIVLRGVSQSVNSKMFF